MINYIFDLIEDHLKQVGVFNYISHDYGQLSLYAKPPVRFPVAIYDVTQVDYTNQSQRVQSGTALLSIKIAHKAVNRSSQSSIAYKSRDIFEYISAMHNTLHGKSTAYITPLTRSMMRKLSLSDDMVGYEITYRCSFSDDGAAPTYTAVESVTPQIDIT